MGRFVAAALLGVAAAQGTQLFAAPAPAMLSPQVVAVEPTFASPALRGAVTPAAAPEPQGSAVKIGAALCAGAAVFALSSRARKAPAISADVVRRSAVPTMVIDPSHAVDVVDAASTLLAYTYPDGGVSYPTEAMTVPLPPFTPGKAFVMMASNLAVITGMTIEGKGLQKGIASGMSPKEAHDDMVNSFGLTWLLSGTSLGHIVGAGAILGCEAAGVI